MKKIVFIIQPCDGNVLPVLDIVKKLVDRGAEVFFYTCNKHKSMLDKLGAVSLDYRYPYFDSESNKSIFNYHNFDYMKYLIATTYEAMELHEKLSQTIIADINSIKPDLIIHDCFSLTGKILAKQFSIPAINIIPSYALNSDIPNQFLKLLLETGRREKYDETSYETVKKAYFNTERMVIRKYPYILSLLDAVTSEEDMNIALSCVDFNMFRDSFNSTYRFVGRLHKNEPSKNPKAKKENFSIYISMGTLFDHERDFYTKCIQAFNDTKHQVIMKVPKNDLSYFRNMSSRNISLYEYVPQLDVLEKSDLFISHCGNNSFYEAIELEVPLMCCPIGIDQFFVSKTAVELGIGEIIDPQEISTQELYNKAINLINNRSVLGNLTVANKKLRKYKMFDSVVDTIITY